MHIFTNGALFFTNVKVGQLFENCHWGVIDTVSNLVFWSRFANKLEPWHNVYIIQH